MRTLLIFLFCITVELVTAQKNAVYVEALGNGGKASLNFERRLTANPVIAFRIGLGVTEDNLIDPSQLLSVTSSIHYLFDLKKGNYVDVSIGVSRFETADEGPAGGVYQLISGVGFRRKFGKNWFFRGHISPYIWTLTKSKELPSLTSTSSNFGGFYFPSSPRFYRYSHEDTWLGFSIGIRF